MNDEDDGMAAVWIVVMLGMGLFVLMVVGWWLSS